MRVVTNIVYLLGGIIVVAFFLLASDMPDILMGYKYPIVGIYIVLLLIVEVIRRKKTERR